MLKDSLCSASEPVLPRYPSLPEDAFSSYTNNGVCFIIISEHLKYDVPFSKTKHAHVFGM